MKKIYAIIAGLFLFVSPVVADVTVSDLPSAGTLNGDEELIIFRSDIPYKTSGSTLTGSIELPANVDVYGCTVDDDLGGGDYQTIEAAWAAGCRSMYIRNGTYAPTSNLESSTVGETIKLVGESMEGVLIDTSNAGADFIKLTNVARTYTGIGSFALPAGSTIITGTDTTFITDWDLVAGDMIAFVSEEGAEVFLEVESIPTELRIDLVDAYYGTALSGYTTFDAVAHGWHYAEFSNFTWTDTTNEFIDGVSVSPILFYPTVKNVKAIARDDFFYSGSDTFNAIITDSIFDREVYVGDYSILNNVQSSDAYGYAGNFLTFGKYGDTYAPRVNQTVIGNIFSTTGEINFSAQAGSVGIGNRVIGGTIVEQLWSSLNLPDSLYIDGSKLLQYDTTSKGIVLGESAADPSAFGASTGLILIGLDAGDNLVDPSTPSIFIGKEAGAGSGTTPSPEDNIGIGNKALKAIQTNAYSNVAIGNEALTALTTGEENVAIGYQSGYGITTGGYNFFLGTYSAWNLDVGQHNVGIGYDGMGAYGSDGEADGLTASYNVGIGSGSLPDIDDATHNVFLGYFSGGGVEDGNYNIGVGANTLNSADVSNNVAIGYKAGEDATGNGNVFIGYMAAEGQTAISNELWIDNSNTATPLIHGSFNATPASATLTVNAGTFSVLGQGNIDGITFDYNNYNQDTTPGPGDTHTIGHTYFNTDEGTLDVMTNVSDVVIQVGQEVLVRVENAEVDTLNNGEVVYVFSAVADGVPSVKRAQSDGTHVEAQALGLVTADIAAGGKGFVTCMGKVRGLDTATPEGASWNIGDMLYVSSTLGTLTKTKPTSPDHTVPVGIVTRDHASAGVIFVTKPEHGFELGELHDVDQAIAPSLTTGTVLMWDNANLRWTDSETITYTRHLQIAPSEIGNPAQVPDKDDIDGIVGCYAFDGGASVEELHLQFEVPDDWDGGDIIFEIDTAPMVAMIDTETYTFDITYRAIAEGEVLTQGVAATRTSSYTSSGATAQYYFTHPQATIDYDDATQPLAKQDHIFIVIDRNDADSYASDVCISAFEIIYESTGLPRI